MMFQKLILNILNRLSMNPKRFIEALLFKKKPFKYQ